MTLNPAGETVATGIPGTLAENMTMAEQHDWHRSFLRRHPVSRRNFLVGAAATAAAVGVDVDDPGVLVDVDTLADLDSLRRSGLAAAAPAPRW